MNLQKLKASQEANIRIMDRILTKPLTQQAILQYQLMKEEYQNILKLIEAEITRRNNGQAS